MFDRRVMSQYHSFAIILGIVLSRYARLNQLDTGALCWCNFAVCGCMGHKIEVQQTTNINVCQWIFAPQSKWRPWHVPCLPYPRYAPALEHLYVTKRASEYIL